MSEDKQLLGRIADLAGQINHRKVQFPFSSDSTWPRRHSISRVDCGSLNPMLSDPVIRGLQRFQSRGRNNKTGPRPHHHRSLVLKNTVPASNSPATSFDSSLDVKRDKALDEGETADGQPCTTATWISKRDRHMQLINSSIYNKETNVRQQAIDKTRHEQALRRNQREMVKIRKHLRRIADSTAPTSVYHSAKENTSVYEVIINGLRFQVLKGGSKLLRTLGITGLAGSTPKQAVVGGVTFLRSKNGNLYREGLVRAMRRSGTAKKILEPCKRFTTTGTIFLTLQIITCLSKFTGVDVPKVLSVSISTTHEKLRFAPLSFNVETALLVNVAIFRMISLLNEFPLVYIFYVVDVRSLHVVIHTPNSSPQRSVDGGQSDVSSAEEDLDEIDSDDVDSEGWDDDEAFVPNHRSTVSLEQQHDFIGF
ncbi:hypothetical protein MMC26_007672 [Xylographa opegraphella]|nr:hypothetical protein [Xylographa opegraphella]